MNKGFTLVEVLIAVVMISICAVSTLMWQKTSWERTARTNRIIVAGQVIEKQVEMIRQTIAQNPKTNFDQFKDRFIDNDVVIIDSSSAPFIHVRWNVYDTLHSPTNKLIKNVCQVKLAAWWNKQDTIRVTTCIAKNF